MDGDGKGVSWGAFGLGLLAAGVAGAALGALARGAAEDVERQRTLERVQAYERAVAGSKCRDAVAVSYARWLRTKPGGYEELRRLGVERPEDL